MTSTTPDGLAGAEATAGGDLLLPELVAHLREHRTGLRREWANRITDAHLLTAMTPQEVFPERPRCTTTTSGCWRPPASRRSWSSTSPASRRSPAKWPTTWCRPSTPPG